MSEHFCGNPFNHNAHTVEEPSGKSYRCDGVDRVGVKEEIVEKFDPSVEIMDGRPYVKVKIFVEYPNGDTDIVQCDKASAEQFEVEHQKYVALDYATRDFSPRIERAIFSFTPFQPDEGPAFTIERKKNHGE